MAGNSTPLKQTTTIPCNTCDQEINEYADICPECGIRQRFPSLGPTPQKSKSRLAAVLFAFFLGGFGAHKFYLGKTGFGLLYLVFIWTLIPSLIALVEFIILLTMSDETFNQKYSQPP